MEELDVGVPAVPRARGDRAARGARRGGHSLGGVDAPRADRAARPGDRRRARADRLPREARARRRTPGVGRRRARDADRARAPRRRGQPIDGRERLLGGGTVEPEVLDRVVVGGGGEPALRGAARPHAGRRGRPRAGRTAAGAPPGRSTSLHVPPTIQALLAARLDTLAERRALRDRARLGHRVRLRRGGGHRAHAARGVPAGADAS